MNNLINLNRKNMKNWIKGDVLIFQEVRKALEKEDVLEVKNITKDRRFLAAFNFTRRQRRILLEGGLINFVRGS